MVSGERPKTLHRGKKTSNTSLEMRFRACGRSSTRCRAGVYGTPGSALQVHHCQWHCCDRKSHTLHTREEGILSQFKSKARQHSHTAALAAPAHSQPSLAQRGQSHCTGVPRGRGAPQLPQAAGLVHPCVLLQGLGSACAVSCTLLYSPPSV